MYGLMMRKRASKRDWLHAYYTVTVDLHVEPRRKSSAFFRNYLITAFIIGFVAPVSIISYCYTKIITTMNLVHRRAKQANAKISKSTSMASNSRLEARPLCKLISSSLF